MKSPKKHRASFYCDRAKNAVTNGGKNFVTHKTNDMMADTFRYLHCLNSNIDTVAIACESQLLIFYLNNRVRLCLRARRVHLAGLASSERANGAPYVSCGRVKTQNFSKRSHAINSAAASASAASIRTHTRSHPSPRRRSRARDRRSARMGSEKRMQIQ